MARKIVLIVLAAVAVVSFSSCDILGGATGVEGMLILEPGQTGDVRNARVELYQKSDLTGDPVKYGQSKSDGPDASEAEFEIEDVLAGYYYLLAWKDMDNDGEITGGDLVGVYGGSYTPGEGGQQLTIEDGKMTDAGNISMKIYVEPVAVLLTATKRVDNQSLEYAEYTYTFNKDVSLTSVTLNVTGYPAYVPDTEKGARSADTPYSFDVYFTDGESVFVPSGVHSLTFVGTDDEGSFTLTPTVTF